MNTAIIGTNFISLSVALRLVDKGHHVTIYEKSQTEWGGAWKLKDMLGWKQKETAWHVILYRSSDIEYFKEFFGYFNFHVTFMADESYKGDGKFYAPKYLVPDGGINSFIQDLNTRVRNCKNISIRTASKVDTIVLKEKKLNLVSDDFEDNVEKLYFNSCVDLKQISLEDNMLQLPYSPRVATHIMLRFEGNSPFLQMPHLMHVDEITSDYVFDLIGQLVCENTSERSLTLIVIRIKREYSVHLRQNTQRLIKIIAKQISELLRFKESSRLLEYVVDYHRTVYRTDMEMNEVMHHTPDCIQWIPTQDLSKTIPHLMTNIWDDNKEELWS